MMPSVESPSVEVYYAATCLPCRQEIPALTRAADDIPLVIYVLDSAKGLPPLAARIVPTAPQDPRDVLRRAGDDQGILPYARSVRADGSLCGSWRGKLTLERIHALINLCAAPAPPPP